MGHGWHEAAVEILLAHATDEEGDVVVAVGETECLISWFATHAHVYAKEGTPEEPWTSLVLTRVAALLRARYQSDDYYWGSRLLRTVVVDRTTGKRIGSTRSLLGRLPSPHRHLRVERRTLDFGCRHS